MGSLVRGWHVASLALLLALCFATTYADECREEDFIGQYTACQGGFKNLIYYKNPDSDCTGTTNQPSNIFRIPCALSCPSGQYLPLGSQSEAACTPCGSGSYSLGGGVRIEGSSWVNSPSGWNAMSNNQISFRSTCVNTRDGTIPSLSQCTRWTIVDGVLTSSNRTGDNMMSVLEASATFVRPGTISFDYRVDSERDFDYFSFDIDETNKIRMESQRLDYVKVSFNVDIGTHVFKWKYTKDFSLAYGDDAVIVRMIEVTGTAFADSTCTQCPAGTFAAGVGNVGCTDCAANSAAPNPGMAQCNDCGPTKFSYSGAATCRDRVDCVASDVFSYFSDCFANRTRNKYYAFLEPKICSDLGASAYKKPADVYSVACAPCSPGWYRNSEGVCQGCPTNYMSPGGGQDVSSCQACPTGHVGRRDFIWTNFEELPSAEIPASMGCRGECGTPGWRLGPNFIDSGVGHNAYADSYFMLNLTTTIDSSVSFNYSFECDRLCYISYTDHDITGSNASDPHLMQTRTSYSFFFTKSTHLTMEIPVSSGDHMFTWHFSKFDRTVDSKEDRIKIYGIQIKSVKENQGGAASCQPCSAGYYADSAFPYCKLTPPGTFSGNLASVPTDCPVNTYAELPGSTGCLACGAGTTAPARSAWCDESCTFQLRPDLSYDLKPLSRVQGDMYGPIVDPATRRNFFINVCTREHTNSSCVNDDGFPVSTQACLADIYGYGMDVGRVTNFYAHPTTPEMGLKLTYTRSNFDTLSTCRIGGVTTPRTTSILFNCDPTAGYGTPTFSAVGSNSCTFNFVWNTLFACPACDDSDWSYYYTECSNGKQMKTYQWKDNPRKCHGGLPLPESVERPCTVETQVCPKGQYLLEECTDCESGKFSLGGARVVNYWQMGSPIQAPFSALPSEVSAAVPRGSFVQLAFPPTFQGNWVSLQAEFNFIQASTVTFSASALVGEGYTLSLRQDAQDFTPFATALTAQLYTIPVNSGTHSFTFNLTRSKLPGTLMPGFLRLYNFTANDIARAASQCTSATPGTIVTSPTQQSTPCPINTYQPSGSQTSCKSATAENRWAPEGSTMSYLPPACNYQDFMPTAATTCSNGRMNYNMDYKQPRICQNGWPQSAISTSCSCLPGYRMDNNGNCITCSANEAYDESTRTCRRPAKGSAAVKIWSMIKGRTSLSAPSSAARNVDATEAGLDATWTTSCSGKCFRAWSVSATPDLGLVMDSGIQMSNAISTLDIDVPMSNQAGLLSISYTKTAGPTTTFMILVDGVVVHTDKQTTRQFPLKAVAGSHKISLVLMVDPNTDGADVLASATIRVDSLTVTGAAVGGAVIQRCPAGTFASEDGAMACIACEPGTYASAEGSSTCTMCAAGTFAAFYGSATCTACPAGTTAEGTGAKLCDANCLLTVGSLTYDWRDLHPTYATLTPEQRALGFPDIQIDPCVGLPEYCSGSSAYVCGTSPLSATANNVNYGSRLYRQSFTSNAILIQYDSGERCLSSSSLSRTANLQLRCPPRPNFATSAPVITSLSDCHVELTWFTNSACPACTAADYKAVPGECSGRQQTVNYVLSSEGCHHSEYTQPPSTVRKCSSVGVSIGVVVGVGIAIIFLALSLAIFFLRHRKLSTEYRLLKDAHDSNFDLPETQFGVDDEEDGVTLDHIDDDDDGLRLPTAQTAEDDE